MKTEKILTVIICCYNAEAYLEVCLKSLIKQRTEAGAYSVILIDDGSTDGTSEIIRDYRKRLKNFTDIRNEKNVGLIASCNLALSKTKTPFYMRLDADDYLASTGLDSVLRETVKIKHNEGIVFSRYDLFEEEDRVVEPEITNDVYTWVAAGVVFPTENVIKVGGYSDEYWEEYDLFIKLLELNTLFTISRSRVYWYRHTQQSMTFDREACEMGYKRFLKKWGDTAKKYGDCSRLLNYYNRGNNGA